MPQQEKPGEVFRALVKRTRETQRDFYRFGRDLKKERDALMPDADRIQALDELRADALDSSKVLERQLDDLLRKTARDPKPEEIGQLYFLTRDMRRAQVRWHKLGDNLGEAKRLEAAVDECVKRLESDQLELFGGPGA